MLKRRAWFLTSVCCFNFIIFSLGNETAKIMRKDPAQTRNAVSDSLESHSVTVTGDSCIHTCLEVSKQSSSSSFAVPTRPKPNVVELGSLFQFKKLEFP